MHRFRLDRRRLLRDGGVQRDHGWQQGCDGYLRQAIGLPSGVEISTPLVLFGMPEAL
jgi:hypothetical protein